MANGQVTYWGTTSNGGAQDQGTIYSITEGGVHTVAHEMERFEGVFAQSDLLQVGGKFYGVTRFGGEFNSGVLFEWDPATDTYTIRRSFNGTTDGGQPLRGLTQAINGRLYGVCSVGGANGVGTLFEYILGNGNYTVRHNFGGNGPGTNGGTPICRLERNGNGSFLYGTTRLGGTNGQGTVFRYGLISSGSPGPTGITTLASFTGAAGVQPFNGVTFDGNNRLYGVTPAGGAGGGGVLFYCGITTPTSLTAAATFSAAGSDGTGPRAEPVVQGGNVYFSTATGGTGGFGKILRYDPSVPSTTAVHSFSNANGFEPFAGMVVGTDGLLYGTTNAGGTNQNGVLFSFNTATSTYTKLKDLSTVGLSGCQSRPIEASSGVWLGTTTTGGDGNGGGLYEYTATGSTLGVLFAFNYSPGSSPAGRMVRASDGLFYGLCINGGTGNKGVLYSFDINTNTYTLEADLGGTLGAFPEGELVEVNGSLYGMCSDEGLNGSGTLFEFDLATGTYTVRQQLSASLGANPKAGLVLANDGNLYGTTSTGGASNQGTLVRFNPVTNSFSVAKQFQAADGSGSVTTPLLASTGLLYGTCALGGASGEGTLWSFDPATSTFAKLRDLNALVTGESPSGDLVELPNGILYGTAASGGASAFLEGSIWVFDPVADTASFVHSFDNTFGQQGAVPFSSLLIGSTGRLYGTCSTGGTGGGGTIWRFDPVSLVFTVLHDFDGTNGSLPTDGLATETIPGGGGGVQVALRGFLDGAYDSNGNVMRDDLRQQVFFPLTEPYSGLGFTQVNGGGGETIAASVLLTTGSNAIVDWVFVELRSSGDNTNVVATRSALVQRDGDVVDTDGVSPLTFSNTGDGSYFVALRHRNHLGVMTASAIALSGSPVSIDLTTASTATFGTQARRDRSGILTLWPGEVVRDGAVKYTGAGNDRDPILTEIGGSIPTATTTGYKDEDVSLDGVVKYTGADNDRDPILQTIGGSVPTSTRSEQLP